MRLLGKPAGAILWEIAGPQLNRNHFFPAVAPAVDIWLNAPATVTLQMFYNPTAIVRVGNNYGPVTTQAFDDVPGVTATASSPNPINMAEGQQPDPSTWAPLGAAIVGGAAPPPVTLAPAPLATPTFLRLVLTVIGVGDDGYVKMVTRWE